MNWQTTSLPLGKEVHRHHRQGAGTHHQGAFIYEKFRVVVGRSGSRVLTIRGDAKKHIKARYFFGKKGKVFRGARKLGRSHFAVGRTLEDRKSTRLNSSHVAISYAVFC